MDYPGALEFFDSLINYEKEVSPAYPEPFKLDRMKRLAREWGNPQNSFESILIAGSKGKGSTAAMLSSILRMENFRVGFFISPHLLDVRERIQVNGLWISEARVIESALKLRKILNGYEWKKDPPTYFEALTITAFSHFKEMKAHVAVLEVGLGGLYDSTNIAPAKVAGFAPISLEHTDKLGKTVSKIAVQKCGILKGREHAVSAPQSPEAEAVIVKTSREKDAALWRVGHDIKIAQRDFGEDFQRFDVRGPFGHFLDLEIGLRGLHQIENAALAVGLAKALEKKTRLRVSNEAVRLGLLDARWPGRLEKISDRPKIVLDGAHNAESMKKMVAALKRHFNFAELIVVLGVSQDKDLEGILGEILPPAKSLVATQSSNPRALAARSLAAAIEATGKEIFVEEDFRQAFQKAAALAGPEDLVVVTGSLFLVADVRTHFL